MEQRAGQIEGTVSSGDLKGKAFVLYLGPTPAESRLIIEGQIIPCTRAEIIVDVTKPVVEMKLDCWFVPSA